MAFSADYFCCCLYRRPFGRLPRDLSGIGTRACPIALLLYFTVSGAGCHPFAPFYTTFLPSCAHSADEADIFWRSSFPPGIDAADALTISGCGMIKVIGFGFSLPTLKAPSEFSGNKPDLPRFLSARKPHRGGRVFCPFLPSFSVLRKTWLQAHGLFYCF